jgi:hypothetical protein
VNRYAASKGMEVSPQPVNLDYLQKDAVTVYLVVLSQHLLGRNEKNHKRHATLVLELGYKKCYS